MNFWNTVKVSWKAILTNKSRSLLTMLGVIIGVGSVILLTSIGAGIQEYIEGQFEDLGSNQVVVFPLQVFNESGGFRQGDDRSAIGNKQLSMDMVRDIRRLDPAVDGVLPELSKTTQASYQSTSKDVTVLGTTHEYARIRNTKTAKGSFFSEEQERAKERVVTLGYKIANDLFGKVDPVGKKIRVGNQTFTVTGVAEEKGGSFGGPTFDDYVFMPIEMAFSVFDTKDVSSITVQVRETKDIQHVIDVIDRYMIEVQRRKEEEFDVFDQRQILTTINQVLGVLTVGLGGIAAISLVVGGIGIMNIMLVSVTERTREIGLRKALGATPRVILLQFLIESSLLSVLGGAIGVAIAMLGSFLIMVAADFPSKVTPGAILLAFGVSVGVGVVFGVAPARKASQLSPIEALRSE